MRALSISYFLGDPLSRLGPEPVFFPSPFCVAPQGVSIHFLLSSKEPSLKSPRLVVIRFPRRTPPQIFLFLSPLRRVRLERRPYRSSKQALLFPCASRRGEQVPVARGLGASTETFSGYLFMIRVIPLSRSSLPPSSR